MNNFCVTFIFAEILKILFFVWVFTDEIWFSIYTSSQFEKIVFQSILTGYKRSRSSLVIQFCGSSITESERPVIKLRSSKIFVGLLSRFMNFLPQVYLKLYTLPRMASLMASTYWAGTQ